MEGGYTAAQGLTFQPLEGVWFGAAYANSNPGAADRRAGQDNPLLRAEITGILAARDQGSAPCARVLAALDGRLADLDRRLADMVALRENLAQLRQAGAALPLDDIRGERCVCYLIKTYRDSGQVVIAREESPHD